MKVTEEKIEKASGGFTQRNPSRWSPIRTTLNEDEAKTLNTELNISDKRKQFKAGIEYTPSDFNSRGVKLGFLKTGAGVSERLQKDYGFKLES